MNKFTENGNKMSRVSLRQLIFVFFFTTVSSISSAKEILIGAGNFEPFFMQKDQAGIFVDLIREVFKELPQYQLKFRFMGNYRLVIELEAGRLDAAANIMQASDLKNGVISNPMFEFTDVVITLKRNNFVINHFSDLQNKSLDTFQGAKSFLGKEFTKMAEANPKYKEHAKVDSTMGKLILGRADAIIIDLYMASHYLKTLFKGKVKEAELQIHYLFPVPTAATHMGFMDPKLRDEFNAALKKTRASGAYQAVYQKYKGRF